MASALSITSAVPDPALLDLPWNEPLELWDEKYIAALPKGISRHLVRFVHLGGYVIAIKETSAELARREYDLLRTLQRLDIPCVEPVAVITGRVADDGEEGAVVPPNGETLLCFDCGGRGGYIARPETLELLRRFGRESLADIGHRGRHRSHGREGGPGKRPTQPRRTAHRLHSGARRRRPSLSRRRPL